MLENYVRKPMASDLLFVHSLLFTFFMKHFQFNIMYLKGKSIFNFS